MFYFLFVLLHVFVCVALVFFILIQSNKGMGLSGAFGAMGAGESVFSASGGMNVLVKITIVLAVVFSLMCLGLSIVKPPMRTGGIVDSEYSNAPNSIDSLIEKSQAGGEDVELPAGQEPAGGGTQPGEPPQ